MAEINAEFYTGEIIRDKAASALGFDAPSVLDVVKREAYPDDAAYIRALVETQKAMDDPAYTELRRKEREEQQRKLEKETREAQRREFESIRAGIQLTQMQREAIDKQAAEMARADLAAGKIGASELGRTIEEYAAKLADKIKDSEASSAQFNAFLRNAIHGGNQ